MQLIKHLAKEKAKKRKRKKLVVQYKKRKKPTNLHNICEFQLTPLIKSLMII